MKRIFFLLGAFLLFPAMASATGSITDNVQNVVYIECPEYTGSGVVIFDNVILTNAHVVQNSYGETEETCYGGYAISPYEIPEVAFWLTPTIVRYDNYFDYAFLEATDEYGEPYIFPSSAEWGNADSMILGEDITLLGYPDAGLAGSTITSTSGTISGFDGTDWIKSDAQAEHGNSGGGAFDALGNYFGIPTAVASGELNSYTWIENLNAIFEDAFGADTFTRDYSTLYEWGNKACSAGVCYYFATDEEYYPEYFTLPGDGDETAQVTVSTSGEYDPSKYDAALVERMKGRILLQVEQNGEAWYVNPKDNMRYYMEDGAAAYTMMRYFSLGITDADLAKIPLIESSSEVLTANSVCATNSLANQLKGKILLQVQQHGEAWYVHPDKCYRVYLEDGDAAYDIMRFLSLGIADTDLEKIPSSLF
ncbi:MAG: serine protease [Patescibacteria group bacterium]|jgi:hypothetical protein